MDKVIWENKAWTSLYVSGYDKVYIMASHVVVLRTPSVVVKTNTMVKAFVHQGTIFRDHNDLWRLVKTSSNELQLQLVIGGAKRARL